MHELALFAGAGGGILGGHLLGWECICAVEIEDYPRRVLLARQRDGILPRFPIWDDICTFDGRPWRGRVDVITGGFPCQDISAAGKGEGISGSRSGLWAEMARVIGEVRPPFILVENSPMLVSKGLDVVLSDLAALGYDAKWGIIGADDAGANHHRKRIWVLAYSKMLYEVWSSTQTRKQLFQHRRPLWWNTRPEPSRMDDGLASGLDRLKAIGNGQVPAVAALAWNILTEEEA